MAKIICVLYDDPVDGYPKSYARDNLPKIDQYPGGQTLPTPKAIDFKPGALLGSVSGDLGLRKYLESNGHTFVVTSDSVLARGSALYVRFPIPSGLDACHQRAQVSCSSWFAEVAGAQKAIRAVLAVARSTRWRTVGRFDSRAVGHGRGARLSDRGRVPKLVSD